MGRRLVQMGLGVTLGLLVAILLVLPSTTGDPAGEDPHLLPAPWEVPSSTLIDSRGRPAELPGDFDGVTAVFFGYTHCPDVCPLTLAELGRVADELDPDRASRFRIVFVSVDPERDTPERLRDYLERFHPSVRGMTAASPAGLEETLSAWGVYAGHAEGTMEHPSSGSYLVDHSARTFLLDASGRVVGSFPHSTGADAMRPTVETLLARSGRAR